MKTWISFTIQLLFATTAFAHVEPTYYLQGLIGQQKVGVQIDHFIEVSYLKYFNLDDKRETILKGRNDSTSFYFERTEKNDNNEEVVVEMFHLNHTSKEDWEGIWISGNNSLEVQLAPIIKDSIQHRYEAADAPGTLNPYAYLRTSTMSLNKERVTRLNGYQIVWLKEPISGITSFQIYQRKTSEKTQKLNEWLLNQQLEWIDRTLQCGTYGFRGSSSVEVKIHFINDDLISYAVKTKTACFSQTVTKKTQHFTIQIDSAQVLELEDLFFIGAAKAPKAYSKPWFEYRRTTFSRFILERYLALYPSKFNADDECFYQNKRAWEQPIWYLTDKGLYLGAIFPGIDKSCNEPDWTVLPYEKIQAHLKKTL